MPDEKEPKVTDKKNVRDGLAESFTFESPRPNSEPPKDREKPQKPPQDKKK